MGNMIRVTDKDGRHIATGSHGLSCCFYVSELCKKHVPEFKMWEPEHANGWLDFIHQEATPEDSLVIKILLHDRVTITSGDVEVLKKAIAVYPRQCYKDGPKRVLEKYLTLLQKYGEITLEYIGAYAAMTVTRGAES